MVRKKGLVRMWSTDIVPGVSYVKDGLNLCRLPQGLICIGCCGFDFAKDLSSKKAFFDAILKNTSEYKNYEDKIMFKKRYAYDDLHECGLCRNIILASDAQFEDKCLSLTCPLHPEENNGVELRKGECDASFMCESQKAFLSEWGDKTKKDFLDFILLKDLDWFEYSKKMHDNSLLKEFFDENPHKDFQE